MKGPPLDVSVVIVGLPITMKPAISDWSGKRRISMKNMRPIYNLLRSYIFTTAVTWPSFLILRFLLFSFFSDPHFPVPRFSRPYHSFIIRFPFDNRSIDEEIHRMLPSRSSCYISAARYRKETSCNGAVRVSVTSTVFRRTHQRTLHSVTVLTLKKVEGLKPRWALNGKPHDRATERHLP